LFRTLSWKRLPLGMPSRLQLRRRTKVHVQQGHILSDWSKSNLSTKILQRTPFIVRARDLSSCRDLAHGSSCMPTCESGFSYRGSNITCQLGVFDVTGSCFPSQISMKDIENTSAVNFLAVFDPGASIQVYTAVMNYSWAVQNEAIIVLAISQVTGYPPNNITVQIIMGQSFHSVLQRLQHHEGCLRICPTIHGL